MKQLILLTAIAIMNITAFSQNIDSTQKRSATTISGAIDVYYRYDLNRPATSPYNSLTSFTKSTNSFELGMASIKAEHSFGKVSATVDLGFGKRAEEFAYNDANTRLAIKQAYITYAPSAAIKFTAGSWATHIGYEMPDAYLNRNYSMSYMFTNGPFTHTGVKADVSLGGKNALMIGISNPTDYRSAPAMPKSFIAQFSTATKDDKLKAYFNFVGGKQNDAKKMLQGDIVASYAVTGKCSIGINGTMQSLQLKDSIGKISKVSWKGAAIYINVDPLQWLGFTLRTEYIADKDEYLGLKNVWAPTLSANFKIDNLIIIPECRFDKAGNAVFDKNNGTFTTSTTGFMVAAVYHF